jgi:hypothetical protein
MKAITSRKRDMISQLCPNSEEGEAAMATTWSIVARVNSYHMASGYSQDVGRWTRFTLEFGVVVIEPSGSDHGPIWRVYVNFGDHEVGPGATVGHADSVPVDESHPDGGEEITVQLPRDEIFTFWTAILRTAEQHPDLQRDCLVIIEINESDSEVISFVVVVQETMQDVTAPLLIADRREDADAVRRSLRMGASPQ